MKQPQNVNGLTKHSTTVFANLKFRLVNLIIISVVHSHLSLVLNNAQCWPKHSFTTISTSFLHETMQKLGQVKKSIYLQQNIFRQVYININWIRCATTNMHLYYIPHCSHYEITGLLHCYWERPFSHSDTIRTHCNNYLNYNTSILRRKAVYYCVELIGDAKILRKVSAHL